MAVSIPNLTGIGDEIDVNVLRSTLQALSAASGSVEGLGLAGLNTVGIAQAVFIPHGGTIPVGTPTYTIVVELA
jgi:hypothetical protein